MIINHNISALNTHRQLGANNTATENSLEKLSSGLKINKAGDDAAGLAISEKMRGQIKGLDMADKNAQDANSLIQTAEGALNETHDILQRMRELGVQSSNDSNTDVDREAINSEISQLSEEIDRIGDTTEFNTKKLVDGSIVAEKLADTDNAAVMSSALGKQTAATAEGGVNANENNFDPEDGDLELKIDGANIDVDLDGDDYSDFKAVGDVDTKGYAAKLEEDVNSAIADYNKANETEVADVSVDDEEGNISITSGSVGETSTVDIIGNDASQAFGLTDGSDTISKTGSEGEFSASGAAAAGAINDDDTLNMSVDGTEIEVTLSEVGDGNSDYESGKSMGDLAKNLETDINNKIGEYNETVSSDKKLDNVSTSVKGGSLVVESGSDQETSSIEFDNSESSQLLGLAKQNSATQGGGLDFQIGANEDQTMNVTIEDMRTDALGIDDIDLSTKEGASEAITKIDNAIENVSDQRSTLGAFQNRLDHTINNLGTSSENLTAAESRIRDVDYDRVNCWKPLKSFLPHNAAGNGRRDGVKRRKIGQSAAEHLWRKPGEGSTTRIDHLKQKLW